MIECHVKWIYEGVYIGSHSDGRVVCKCVNIANPRK